MDEGENVVVSLVMVRKALVMAGGVVGDFVEMLGEPTVEAFDHSVGLRPEGAAETVNDAVLRTETVDGMVTGGTSFGLALLVDGEAVGPFAAVVGKDGVDLERKGREEAIEEADGGLCVAPRMDLDIDEAGGAIDGDEGIGRFAIDARQMLQIDMNCLGPAGLAGRAERP